MQLIEINKLYKPTHVTQMIGFIVHRLIVHRHTLDVPQLTSAATNSEKRSPNKYLVFDL